LSMEEQRILDEMERKLAAEDPRLASRFNGFGQQRLSGTLTSGKARLISCLLALALIAAVTVMMFVLSPYGNGAHHATTTHSAHPAAAKNVGKSGKGS
jgi:hypothetical protein